LNLIGNTHNYPTYNVAAENLKVYLSSDGTKCTSSCQSGEFFFKHVNGNTLVDNKCAISCPPPNNSEVELGNITNDKFYRYTYEELSKPK
jgi:hypothetical protein